ncbi:carboxylesterase/lipase family protein [Shewanella sp. UCD-KL21]|uniref:carboxylesterase/lipase family protein n=1 Tax=Shewanella sp. UCD-KL21 TaxID=1917164 RepID=UPI001C378059|nr:carboxylesterase family protein [Shewanella sp. UCD-KL21]
MTLNSITKYARSILVFISLWWIAPMHATENPQHPKTKLTLKQGSLIGLAHDNVSRFYNIPYAHNPFIGKRRFQAPEAYSTWHGILDATTLGQPVPQPSRGKQVELVGAVGDLTLNVWAPTAAIKSAKKLPVMVWIPGGAFIRADAGEQVYNGSSFASHEVIVVTVNYRVGVDGFMHLAGAPDNRGILDQIMALQWVQDNIADFGGDPQEVTLFGQSAGAESVAILLGTSKAAGLFNKAIMQSPPMESLTQKQAAAISRSFAEKLAVAATIEGISTVDWTELVSTVIDMGNALKDREQWGMLSWGGTAFLPVVDDDMITGSPMQSLANNADPSINVVVGSTDQESRLYMVPSGAIDKITPAVTALFLKDLSLSGDPLSTYTEANKGQSDGEIFVKIQSDYTFRMPAQHIAKHLLNNGNKVWHYNFSWFSPAFGGRLGPAHFVDVPFAFNTIDSDQAKAFVGSQPPKALAQQMHHEWLSLAKSGAVNWSPYNRVTRPTMRFDTESKQVNDPDKSVRELWRKYPY